MYDRACMIPSRPRSFVAASLASVLVLGAVASVTSYAPATSAADVVITEEARQHFSAGVALLKDPDGAKYEEAYREFKAAYAASPSWKILGNLALCAFKLERDGEAIDAYEKYLAEGGTNIDAGERKQVETDLKTLKTGAVGLKLSTNEKGAMIEDVRVASKGDRIVNIYGPVDGAIDVRLHPGHHIVTAKLDGFDPQTWEIDLAPGASQTHAFELKKPVIRIDNGGGAKPVERPIPVGVYVGAAVTGAFIAGGVVMGIVASGKNSDYKNKNDGNHIDEATKLRDDGKKFNLIADICFGAAVIGAGVTTYLFVSRPEKPVDTGGTNVTATYLPGGGAVLLTGAF
jgi:hypothetical protein